jgi:hypothetical protein
MRQPSQWRIQNLRSCIIKSLLVQGPWFIRSRYNRRVQRTLTNIEQDRWFVGLSMDAEIVRKLFEHSPVDGTLSEAWASQKSFQPKGEDPQQRDAPVVKD